MAQWKRAGPITQRSEDQNLALLKEFPLSLFFIIFLVPVACIIVCSTEQPLKIEVAKNLDNPFVVDSFSSLCFLIQLVFNSLRIPEHIESNRNIILTSF